MKRITLSLLALFLGAGFAQASPPRYAPNPYHGRPVPQPIRTPHGGGFVPYRDGFAPYGGFGSPIRSQSLSLNVYVAPRTFSTSGYQPYPRTFSTSGYQPYPVQGIGGGLLLPPTNIVPIQQGPSPAVLDQQVRLVTSWYVGFLVRQPDADGLQNFVNVLNNQGEDVALSGILSSAEYFQICKDDLATWIASLYTGILNRQPANDEIQHWYHVLVNYGGDRQKMILEFLPSARLDRR